MVPRGPCQALPCWDCVTWEHLLPRSPPHQEPAAKHCSAVCLHTQPAAGGLEHGRARSVAQQCHGTGSMVSLCSPARRYLSACSPDPSRVGGTDRGARRAGMMAAAGGDGWRTAELREAGPGPPGRIQRGDLAPVRCVAGAAFAALALTEQLSTAPCGKPAHTILLLICTG